MPRPTQSNDLGRSDLDRVRLEVCVDDVRGLCAAVAGGADRVELCSALALGGLTPSPGLVAWAATAAIRTHAMIRPRMGDFVVDDLDLDVMRRDIDAMRAAGLAGVVFGACLASGGLDIAALRKLCDHAKGMDITLHRAFDLAPDPAEALEIAVDLGFDRILTSGGRPRAEDGLETLAALVAQARGRIVVMPGSGVTVETVGRIVRLTGACEVHASCSVAHPADRRIERFGFAPASLRSTSRSKVSEMVSTLKALDWRP